MISKFAEQFNNDVIIRYHQKLANLSKQALSIEGLKELNQTIGQAMVPQYLKDIGTILNDASGNKLVNTRTNTLTRGIFKDEEGRPFESVLDDGINEPVEFSGDPDSYTNSKYY